MRYIRFPWTALPHLSEKDYMYVRRRQMGIAASIAVKFHAPGMYMLVLNTRRARKLARHTSTAPRFVDFRLAEVRFTVERDSQ